MLKISCVPLSVGICFTSLSLASGALVIAPYLIATSPPATSSKSSQCRALFATVVNSQNMNSSFYSRKATAIRSLSLTDGKLRSLQSRFSHTFLNLEAAQRRRNDQATVQWGKTASTLVGELNQHCFK
ncbi:MAG: hypothetical protein HC805_03730 [Alkalinema sp. RL_2_19]|nr:hypothetical protein [Alkalinema sp. RL_2_19]